MNSLVLSPETTHRSRPPCSGGQETTEIEMSAVWQPYSQQWQIYHSPVLARSSLKISQTVRIDCHSFLSSIRISVRPSKYFRWKTQKSECKKQVFIWSPGRALRPRERSLRCVYTVECEQNGDISKQSFRGASASQSTCRGDDNHWTDIY